MTEAESEEKFWPTYRSVCTVRVGCYAFSLDPGLWFVVFNRVLGCGCQVALGAVVGVALVFFSFAWSFDPPTDLSSLRPVVPQSLNVPLFAEAPLKMLDVDLSQCVEPATERLPVEV
jgi:hypothetical protein